MLMVESIKNGIVIDHIPTGKGLKIFERLSLKNTPHGVVLLMNVHSSTLGTKDIIKIENVTDMDLRVLGLIDSRITINIIKDGVRVEKFNASIPDKISGLFPCSNPRCITNNDNSSPASFKLISANGKVKYSCDFCHQVTEYKI